MVFEDVLQSPLGLLALLSIVPLVVLYLVRPSPATMALPTFRFLVVDEGRDGRRRALERLRRELLFLLQLLVLVLVSLALAGPYVQVTRGVPADEVGVVVDASASMATRFGAETRFDRAVDVARSSVAGTTTIVLSGPVPEVLASGAPPPTARAALSRARVTGAPGDLSSAIAQAAGDVGEGGHLVVASDFADASDWAGAVATARAEGLTVDLRQINGGGRDNVGIVERSFRSSEAVVTVENTGDSTASRTVSSGDARERVTLQPGDVETVTLPVPAGGGRIELSPRDSLPVDDVAYVAAPDRSTVRVLVLTNDRNRYLTTALSVIDEVELTVEEPPTAIDRQYDVIVFSNVEPERVLETNVEAARETLERGGGVVIQGQPDAGRVGYGDLLIVEPGPVEMATATSVADDPLVAGIPFPPPSAYVAGDLRSGRALVTTEEGAPLVATDAIGGGNVLYYGYDDDESAFRYNYLYPVFWKRAVFHLAGREPLPSLNYRTGDRLQFAEPTRVEGPTGPTTGRTVVLSDAGFYETDDRRVSASLLSATESNATAPPVERVDGVDADRDEGRRGQQVPVDLAPLAAVAALAVVLGEVWYLRRRGDV